MEELNNHIAQITFFLMKEGTTFDSALEDEVNLDNKSAPQTFDFQIDETECRFIYFETRSKRKNPPWIDFVNEQLDDSDQLSFEDVSRSPNGVLLISINDRLFAAVFGRSATSWLDKTNLEPDFGIKTAMNMCGNEEIRQTRSQSNAITPTHIDRQVSRPSDTFVFGLSEAEDLKYISAHIKGQKNTTLQGRDNLTVKVIGDEKLNWDRLIDKCELFIDRYDARDYIELFPNYRNFQPATDDEIEKLDGKLIEALSARDYSQIDLCIPEFLAEEDYSFSYTNKAQQENRIHAFLAPDQLDEVFGSPDEISADRLQKRRIFAYSPAEDRVLSYKYWPIYTCLVYEHELDGSYFTLSAGRWSKVDPDFHKSIADFIANQVREEPPEDWYSNIDISDHDAMQNSEAIFNSKVVELRPSCVLFDRAKLKIGTARKDKEFCDILDLQDDGHIRIINAKQHKDASSINYLFSQSKFYCEAFLNDETFLSEIRHHIGTSASTAKADYLTYLKPKIEEIHGNDYTLCLWLLYNKADPAPTKQDIPLIAQYELKLMHDHLRKICKFRNIILRFIPVKKTTYTRMKKNKAAA